MHGFIEIRQKGENARWQGWINLDFVSVMPRNYGVQNQIIYKYTVRETDMSLEAQGEYHSWEPVGHTPSIVPFADLEKMSLPWDYYVNLVREPRKLFSVFQDVRLCVWFDN